MASTDPVVRIVEGTRRLVQTYGLRRVTVDEIASELRISKKTIYRHFPDKDALLLAVLMSIAGPHLGEVNRIIDQKLSFGESIASIGGVIAHLQTQITPPMFRDLQNMPHLWKHIEQRRSAVLLRFRELIERGQDEGEIRPEINARLMATIIEEAVRFVATPQFFARHNISIGEFASTGMAIFLNGILTESARKGGVR
jgi:AcrR family transcriptional regulator